jgi:hypothetical protein
VEVYETETVVLDAKCTDPNGEDVTITYSGWMDSSTKKTGYDDAGEYEVTVTCSDSSKTSQTAKVKVTVLDKNRPPKISWKEE